jgi:hypothetical protein
MSEPQPDPSNSEWPMTTTAGNKAFKYYSDWQRELFNCARCGWTGTVSGLDLDDPSGGAATIQCPKCYRSIGVVVFPNLSDTEEAAAQGNEEAMRELPGMRERLNHFQVRMDKFAREKLQSIDQLPELPESSLEFLWDIEDAQGETYQIIRLGDNEVWRELAYFDSIPRFDEVKEVLRDKYGARFKSLRPTADSLEWLCGDNAGKLDRHSYA